MEYTIYQVYKYLSLPYFTEPREDGTILAEQILSAGGDHNLYMFGAIAGAAIFFLLALKVKPFGWGSLICIGLAVWQFTLVKPAIIAAATPHIQDVEGLAEGLFSQPLDGMIRVQIIPDTCVTFLNDYNQERCCLADLDNLTINWIVEKPLVDKMRMIKANFGTEALGTYLGGRNGSRLYAGLEPVTPGDWGSLRPREFAGFSDLMQKSMARDIPVAEEQLKLAKAAGDSASVEEFRKWISFLQNANPDFETAYFNPGIALWVRGFWNEYCQYRADGLDRRADGMMEAALNGKAGGLFHGTVWIEPPSGFTWGNMAPKPIPLPDIEKVVTPYRSKIMGDDGIVNIFGEYTGRYAPELLD